MVLLPIDYLYAQPSPAKEISEGSRIFHTAFPFSPLSNRTHSLMPPPFLFVSQDRQISHPFFTKERNSDFHVFDQTSAKALNLIANRAAAYAPIDVQDLLQCFTLDAAALFLWGHARNMLDLPLTQPGRVVLGPKGSAPGVPTDGASEWDELTNTLKTAAVLITCRGVQGKTWPLLKLFKDKTAHGGHGTALYRKGTGRLTRRGICLNSIRCNSIALLCDSM
jgi:hypothetical protein